MRSAYGPRLDRWVVPLLIAAVVLLGARAQAADPPTPTTALPAPDSWSFRAAPYAWITSFNGTQTVKGRTIHVDATFEDILRNSDSLVALMMYLEARKGRWSLLADIVYAKIGMSRGATRSATLAPGITGTLSASLGLDIEMAIVQAAAAYEITRLGRGTAIDLYAGGRYWWQHADAALDLAAALDIGGLIITADRAIARSGGIQWIDPLVGARVRHEIAPGHALTVTGDVGGFGAGSRFSWQLVGTYGFEFARTQGVAWSGVIGYRALWVDYAEGAGMSLYEYKMLQHGPILGVTLRF